MPDSSPRCYVRLAVCALPLVAFFWQQPVTAPGDRPSVQVAPTPDSERIPDRWIDLPEAPFAGVIKDGRAVLVNRSSRDLNEFVIGCVAEHQGVAHMVGRVFSAAFDDAAWSAGAEVGKRS